MTLNNNVNCATLIKSCEYQITTNGKRGGAIFSYFLRRVLTKNELGGMRRGTIKWWKVKLAQVQGNYNSGQKLIKRKRGIKKLPTYNLSLLKNGGKTKLSNPVFCANLHIFFLHSGGEIN